MLLSLLPEGSLRRTSALVLGLIITLCWADSLLSLLSLPALPDMPASALVATGYSAGGE